ncbi:MAG: efflux RND transporter periplasmic adaptor subunit [Rubrivivax sp.]|nr:efflux RND transporter periplasmic adaptor subunit [Rubrivivax sp.]
MIATAALLLMAGLLTACQDKPAAAPAARGAPVEVGVVTVSAHDAPLQLELPGRLSASQVAEIRPQVGGLVLKRLFTEGAVVAAGQPLYELDAASLEAERARAAAALQKAQAQFAASRAKVARDAELLRANFISQAAADDNAAVLRQGEADVAVARAALDAAQVQFRRARIVAPIGGRIEVSTVSAGALVTANQTQALTTIQQLDPMHVDIVQSSAELLALRGQVEGQTASRQVQLVLEDGSVHPQPATLQFSGVTVDRGTGTVTLRAVVPNPQGSLLPGMVVQARLLAGIDRGVLLVPQQGVTRSPTGDATALVVGEGNKVERRRLQLARAVGNQWLVTSGLKVGDRLIVEGLQRARAGQTVTPVAAGAAASAPARVAAQVAVKAAAGASAPR